MAFMQLWMEGLRRFFLIPYRDDVLDNWEVE
jgi:hypothetical protein